MYRCTWKRREQASEVWKQYCQREPLHFIGCPSSYQFHWPRSVHHMDDDCKKLLGGPWVDLLDVYASHHQRSFHGKSSIVHCTIIGASHWVLGLPLTIAFWVLQSNGKQRLRCSRQDFQSGPALGFRPDHGGGWQGTPLPRMTFSLHTATTHAQIYLQKLNDVTGIVMCMPVAENGESYLPLQHRSTCIFLMSSGAHSHQNVLIFVK